MKYEVHEHCYVSGPRANGGCYSSTGTWMLSKIAHSHEGGETPHQHPETGPASYVIDRDEWFRSTGLRGGGRKTYTAKPTGEQLPRVELEAWQQSCEVIVCDPFEGQQGDGPGLALPLRMMKQFGMTARFRDGRKGRLALVVE